MSFPPLLLPLLFERVYWWTLGDLIEVQASKVEKRAVYFWFTVLLGPYMSHYDYVF